MSTQKKPGFAFSVFTGICIIVCMTTCINMNTENDLNRQFSACRGKAGLYMATDPCGTLHTLDSIVKIIPLTSLADSQIVAYHEMKSQAFLKLGMKDSAYSVMQQVYEGNTVSRNTSVKIHAGLWLARNYAASGKQSQAQTYLDESLTIMENESIRYEKSEYTSESLNARLYQINNPFRNNSAILGIVFISALVLVVLLFRIYKLYQQRDEDYNLLFEKYRNETLPKTVPAMNINTGKNPVPEMVSEDTDILYPQLIEYFETGKPYLRSNLRFDDIANELRISRKILSHLIQKHTGMNFNSFVNSYRTKEAIRLLAEPKLKQYKIEAIAHKAGFGSKASFYLAFNQITGSIPSEHR
ncbi:MAG: helix-turn-helix transcriptional regulator [Bacteroidales bacterium]|nr:helix-turn-helix transcriptional regulator [Bacteroidales bacterium]